MKKIFIISIIILFTLLVIYFYYYYESNIKYNTNNANNANNNNNNKIFVEIDGKKYDLNKLIIVNLASKDSDGIWSNKFVTFEYPIKAEYDITNNAITNNKGVKHKEHTPIIPGRKRMTINFNKKDEEKNRKRKQKTIEALRDLGYTVLEYTHDTVYDVYKKIKDAYRQANL